MSEHRIELLSHGIFASGVVRNPAPAILYEDAIRAADGELASSGAMIARSGSKTGRSPKDKRIVEHPERLPDVWWGSVNIPLGEHSFRISRQRALDYLTRCPKLYVIDGFAGWDPHYRLKVRVICSRPYHALFMHNMLIRPTAQRAGRVRRARLRDLQRRRVPGRSRSRGRDEHDQRRPELRAPASWSSWAPNTPAR